MYIIFIELVRKTKKITELGDQIMGKIIIEVEENINLKIRAKNTKEGLKKLKEELEKKEKGFLFSLKIKTKNFKFNRDEAESR